MESVNLDMDDIFGDGGEVDDDDDFPSVGPLPDLPTQSESNPEANEDEENSEVLSKLKDLSKGAAKKVVRQPQPKLDGTRLTGERGIPVLPKVFENVKFKGRGHEAEDLRIVMRYLEHWTHRLFPKMPFDEVLERIERLGTKREVQTCIKKMRLDMPLLNEDFVNNDADDEVDGSPNKANGTDGDQDAVDVDAEEIWDEIMKEEHKRQKTQTPVKPKSPSNLTQQLLDTPSTSTASPSSQPLQGGLTPEQIERIERNKRMALEKKAARNRFGSPGFSSQSLSSQQMPPPSSPYTPRKMSPQKSCTITSPQTTDSSTLPGHSSTYVSPSKAVLHSSPAKVVNGHPSGADNLQLPSQNGVNVQNTKPLQSSDITHAQNFMTLSVGTESQESLSSTAGEMSEVIPIIHNHVNGIDGETQEDGMSEVIPFINKHDDNSEDLSEVILPVQQRKKDISPRKIDIENGE